MFAPQSFADRRHRHLAAQLAGSQFTDFRQLVANRRLSLHAELGTSKRRSYAGGART